MINGHGNDIYNYGSLIKADFSSNIPYCNSSHLIAQHLKERVALIGNYPDPKAHALTCKIAEHHHLSPKNIVVTNGSAEAFYLLAHLFAGKESIITYPAFAEYKDACTLYRHQTEWLPIGRLNANYRCRAHTLWFAIPNNPDGFIVPPEQVQQVCRNNGNTYFIVDTAYGELCPPCSSIVPLHAQHRNLITVHSLTKTFAIPGLRLGYIVADAPIIEQLQQFRTPWSVNALALEAGSFVLENYRSLLPDAEALCAESRLFQQQLAALPHVEVLPSPCNFFLARIKKGTAAQLKAHLVENHGILIRNADNFFGLSPQHFRLSVQQKEANNQLIKALQQYV